ncbi:MAG: alpha/beta hydrolase [Candidatus Gastranaerophilaceae bacterium]|mgnify:FL=1
MTEANSKLPNLTTKTEDFISMLENKDAKPLYKMTPEQARQFLDNLQKETHKDILADVKDTQIFTENKNSIALRIIRPANNNEKLPAIIYLHGGGWVMGGKESFDMLIKQLAINTNSVVIFPEYSRSPEAKYPVALKEIYSVLEYIYENPDEFNIDNDSIAIAGDSAGANMATVTALKAKNQNGPKIKFQCLFYPVTNADMDTKSYDLFKDGPWLSKKAMEWFFEAYAPDKESRNDIYVSPLKADEEDLKGLPPTLIITAENDVLRDEGEAYARKLDSAGVDVLNIRINGTIHDFLMLNALSDTQCAKGALNLACNMLKKALHKDF